jgi:hypothetical protein
MILIYPARDPYFSFVPDGRYGGTVQHEKMMRVGEVPFEFWISLL